MELLEKWREIAYSETANKGDLQRLWSAYFQKEKDIYADLLKNPDEEVKGTVKELAENTAVTESGKITFQKMIVATHFPLDNKHGLYPLKMYQNRSYVIALENSPRIDGMYIDEAPGGLSFSFASRSPP